VTIAPLASVFVPGHRTGLKAIHEVARQPMLVRGDRTRKFGESRIAIALAEIAQHLVVGAVLLDAARG